MGPEDAHVERFRQRSLVQLVSQRKEPRVYSRGTITSSGQEKRGRGNSGHSKEGEAIHVCLPLRRTPPEDREEMQDGAVGGLCAHPHLPAQLGALALRPVCPYMLSRQQKIHSC